MIHQTHTLLLVHTKRQAAEIRLRHADVPRFKWTHSDQLDTINIFFVHSFLKYFKFPNGKVSRLEGHSATRPLPAGAATHTPSLPAAATATAPRLPPQSQGPLLRAGARAASRLRDGALSRRRGCGGAAALREGPGSGRHGIRSAPRCSCASKRRLGRCGSLSATGRVWYCVGPPSGPENAGRGGCCRRAGWTSGECAAAPSAPLRALRRLGASEGGFKTEWVGEGGSDGGSPRPGLPCPSGESQSRAWVRPARPACRPAGPDKGGRSAQGKSTPSADGGGADGGPPEPTRPGPSGPGRL